MYRYNPTPTQDVLMHYGVKGQKWGIRRYQNKDGSYTAAGKKRYSIIGMKIDVAKAKKSAKKENVSGRDKSSTGTNYDRAKKRVEQERTNRKRWYEEAKENEKNAKTEKEAFDSWSTYEKKTRASQERGRRFLTEAMLRDAGYSAEDARRGAEWLKKKGVNLYW